LKKEYDNLLTVDIICHGTPSPGVFRWYLSEEIQMTAARQNDKKPKFSNPSSITSIAKADILAKEQGFKIKDIRFRDKQLGWKKFSFALTLENLSSIQNNEISISSPLNENAFLRGFLANIYLRPSCYACPAKSGKSGSDITLADYWGINSLMPELDDDRGVSAITINSTKGQNALHSTDAELYTAPYEDICKKNPSLLNSCKIPECRKTFFSLKQKKGFHDRVLHALYVPFYKQIKGKVYIFLSKIKKNFFTGLDK
jgi:hypothetical protein